MSKREEIRSKRKQTKQRNQKATLIVVVIGALLVLGVLIIPNLIPVTDLKTPETLTRSKVNANTMGDSNAPVKVSEFADFQCPSCGTFVTTQEPRLIRDYIETGKVLYTYVAFSFLDEGNPNRESKKAAEAVYCAMDQNKFWNLHDYIYANQNGENQGAFADKRLKAMAQKAGLDMGAFNSCFSAGTYTSKVLDDLKLGESKGVSSTPSFFVNDKLVTLNTYDDLYKAIDAAMPK